MPSTYDEGTSGDTPSDALARFVPIIAARPAWIVSMLGTNDALRVGLRPSKTVVSLDETARNLAELRHLAATATEANWAWITSPTCNEASVAASPYSTQDEMSLSNDDLVAIADDVRTQPDPVVDLVTLFGDPPAAELMLEDGIHPSLIGQQTIVRALVEQLTP